jgi:hypothetical protein
VHPPAVARRQQARDLALLMPVLDGLSDSQRQLLSLVLSVIGRHGTADLGSARDTDIVDGVSAQLATIETAARGVIYEHRPATLPGQRLATDIRGMFADLAGKAGRSLDADAAAVLARVIRLADGARKTFPGNDTAFLDLVKRVARTTEQEGRADRVPNPSPIIVP